MIYRGVRMRKALKITGITVGGLVAAFVVLGVIGMIFFKKAPEPAAAPTPAPAAVASAPTTDPADTDITHVCQVDDQGGTFYLVVHSGAWHDFSPCDGFGTISNNAGDLVKIDPTINPRCSLPITSHYDVVVYSGTGKDLAAAKDYCANNAGTDS